MYTKHTFPAAVILAAGHSPKHHSLHNVSRPRLNTITNASSNERVLSLSSAGNVVSILHCYTLGLLIVSSHLVLLLIGLTIWLTLYTPTSREASSNMLFLKEITMNCAFFVRSLM